MSNLSPINDFDAYKHEWDKNDYSQKKVNNFSLGDDSGNNYRFDWKTRYKDFFNSPIPFTKTVIALCTVLYAVTFLFPSLNYYLAYNPVSSTEYPWVIFTSGFIHSGLMHIFFNLITLYYVGSELEKMIGTLRIASIFFISVIGGSALTSLSVLYDSQVFYTFTLGASGGIFGLFGTIFILQKRAGISTTPMIILILINLSMGFLIPNIAIMGHLGGLIFGTLSAYLLTRRKVYYSKKLTLFIVLGMMILTYALCFSFYLDFSY